jgi:hypothetical protein
MESRSRDLHDFDVILEPRYGNSFVGWLDEEVVRQSARVSSGNKLSFRFINKAKRINRYIVMSTSLTSRLEINNKI